MSININFKFPNGCSEDYNEATMPVVPRIGEFIQGERPQSGRYRVTGVVYGIDPESVDGPRCSAVTVILEALDEINFDIHRGQ